MEREDFKTELKTVLLNQGFLNKNQELNENSNLKDDLGLDSLDLVETIMELESHLGKNFDDGDILDNAITVKDLIDICLKKVNS